MLEDRPAMRSALEPMRSDSSWCGTGRRSRTSHERTPAGPTSSSPREDESRHGRLPSASLPTPSAPSTRRRHRRTAPGTAAADPRAEEGAGRSREEVHRSDPSDGGLAHASGIESDAEHPSGRRRRRQCLADPLPYAMSRDEHGSWGRDDSAGGGKMPGAAAGGEGDGVYSSGSLWERSSQEGSWR